MRNLLIKQSNNTSICILCSKMYLWLMKLMVDNAKPDHMLLLLQFLILNFAYGCTQVYCFIFIVKGKELRTGKEPGKRVLRDLLFIIS